jgi:hypothetical protein
MKKKKSNFKDKVASNTRKQKTAGTNYGYLKLPKGLSVFSPEAGRITIDILPYLVTDKNHPDRDTELDIAVEDTLWYKRPFKIHRNIGVEKDSVVCLTSFGKKCPICEYVAKRKREQAPKDEIDAIKPSNRNLYIIHPIGSKKFTEDFYIWDISQWLFQNLLNDELEEDDANAQFPDLEDGLSLKIRFEAKSLGSNNFVEVSRIDFLERANAYDESVLDEIPNLDTILQELSYKELSDKFFELEGEEPFDENDDTNEDDDDEPKKRKPLGRKPKKEVEEEDEADDDDDDDEPAPPKRSKTVSRKKPEPEPEPDEDLEEGMQICVACEGSGMNSKGRTCPICKGSGEVPIPEDEDDDEPAPVKAATRKRQEKPGKKDRCPHNHVFGKDTDEFDECDECSIWEECIDVKEG